MSQMANENKWRLYAGGPDGSKRWFLYTLGADGKRVKDYAGLGKVADLDQRKAMAERLLAERNAPAPILADGQLSPIARQWLADHETDRKRTNQIRASIARVWERELRAAGLWYTSITAAFAGKFARKYSHNYVAQAKSICALAAKLGNTVPDAWADVRTRKDHQPATLIPANRVPEVLAHLEARDPQLWLLCVLQYYTFIRPMEWMRMEITDIHLSEGYIQVPGTKSKNRKTQRVVITVQLAALLAQALKQMPPKQRFVFEYCGRPYASACTFRIRHHKALAKLALPRGVNLYSWKHTGAVAAAKAGVPLKQLQMQLRHASLDQVAAYLRQMGLEDMTDVLKGW